MIDLRGSPSCRESPLRGNELFGLRARTDPTGSRCIGRHSRYHVEGTSQVELELGGSPRPDSPTRSGGTPTLWRVERNTCWREAPCIPSPPRGEVALAKTATPVSGSPGKPLPPLPANFLLVPTFVLGSEFQVDRQEVIGGPSFKLARQMSSRSVSSVRSPIPRLERHSSSNRHRS